MNDYDQNQQQNGPGPSDTGQFVSVRVLVILATLFMSPAILVLWPFLGLEEAWRTALINPWGLIGSYFFWLTTLFIWAHQKDK